MIDVARIGLVAEQGAFLTNSDSQKIVGTLCRAASEIYFARWMYMYTSDMRTRPLLGSAPRGYDVLVLASLWTGASIHSTLNDRAVSSNDGR